MSAIWRDNLRAISFLGSITAVITATGVFWLANSGERLANGGGDMFIAFGRLSGLLLMLMILAQILLASRAPILDAFYDFAPLRLHRILGFTSLGLVAAHIVLLTAGYAARAETGWATQFVSFISSWEDVGDALLAVIILTLVGVISLKIIRSRMRYEAWYALHLTLYAAFGLAIGHQISTGDMADGAARVFWLALMTSVSAVFVLYRFIRPLWYAWRCGFRVARVARESPDTVSVYLSGVHMEAFRFEAGQYARLFFLQRGLLLHGHHPFSFSQPYDGKEIRFTIRQLGDFTSRVETLQVGTRVIIDGPTGNLTTRSSIANKLCLIAGGIGITPIVSIARSLTRPADAVVLVSSKTHDNAPLVAELRALGVDLHEYVSNEPPNTRIDGDEILRVCPDVRMRDVYICGPEPMMDALSLALIERGVPRERIHAERFAFT